MHVSAAILVLLLLSLNCDAQLDRPFDGEKSDFHSFDCYDFTRAGAACKVVVPKQVAEGRPWIWRARFFGHEPQLDIALLEKGFHVAYCDVADLFGAPAAVARWDEFYKFLVEEKGFHRKPALEGMSRGGLIIYNWAKKNPDKVSCIYADAPVCDIRSWPSGKGQIWQQCLLAYGLQDEAEVQAFRGNPIDGLGALAKAKVPLIHVVGDADDVVPVKDNTAILEKRYKALGGEIQVIHKPGVGHHPHSLKDPTPLVDFITRHVKP
jgi:pimeloyl-ACP methyl ester carboxylesterase